RRDVRRLRRPRRRRRGEERGLRLRAGGEVGGAQCLPLGARASGPQCGRDARAPRIFRLRLPRLPCLTRRTHVMPPLALARAFSPSLAISPTAAAVPVSVTEPRTAPPTHLAALFAAEESGLLRYA